MLGDIHDLIARFSRLDFSLIGRGPKHPTKPMVSLQSEIDDLFSRYLLLKQDAAYLEFMETYAGAAIHYGENLAEQWDLSIYGFYIGWIPFAWEIDAQKEKLIDTAGFFTFAHGSYFCPGKRHYLYRYAFHMTGDRKPGVYWRKFDWSECPDDAVRKSWYWIGEGFTEWLTGIVEKEDVLWKPD